MKGIALVLIFLSLLIGQQAYSPGIAHELVHMSAIAYESPDRINAWNCESCSQFHLHDTNAFGTFSSQAFTGYSHRLDAIIISFRGSNNIPNWITNINVLKASYPSCQNCQVHKGFFNLYKKIRYSAISHLQALRRKYQNAKIYVTGHSLGGALAVFAGLQAKTTLGYDIEIMTFGQPRVGNQQFSNYVGSHMKHIRVVHYGDIVPHLPPSKKSFHHSGTLIWYNRGMRTFTVCKQGDYQKCYVPIHRRSIRDHRMKQYLALQAHPNNIHRISY